MPRAATAIDPGTAIAIGTSWTTVLDADDAADPAIKFILQNNSSEDIEVALDAGADAGLVLVAGPGGGMWEETDYAGTVVARHGGTGTHDLVRIIF